jgi:anion-transporting  ArsA/GET3 family ATPase
MDLQALATGVLGGIGGGAALFMFLSKAALGRLEAKWNKDLEAFKDSLNAQQKRLQTQLDSSLFVTRAHFEVELNAMKDVHQRLAEVKIAFQALHPTSQRNQKHEEEQANQVEKLRTATEAYSAKLAEWGAFLEIPLYDSFERCYYGADEEWKRLSEADTLDPDGALNCRQFFDNYREACQGIRDRLKKLAILPGS